MNAVREEVVAAGLGGWACSRVGSPFGTCLLGLISAPCQFEICNCSRLIFFRLGVIDPLLANKISFFSLLSFGFGQLRESAHNRGRWLRRPQTLTPAFQNCTVKAVLEPSFPPPCPSSRPSGALSCRGFNVQLGKDFHLIHIVFAILARKTGSIFSIAVSFDHGINGVGRKKKKKNVNKVYYAMERFVGNVLLQLIVTSNYYRFVGGKVLRRLV